MMSRQGDFRKFSAIHHNDRPFSTSSRSSSLYCWPYALAHTYVRTVAPRLVDRNKEGFLGLFFMAAQIGE
ncbi:hypothetical protein C8J56DRAFT_920623 [Mycena floridula]|nr:hypothetical protein C8J56DRAFT_920623 [Mycena floridula]